MRNLNINGKSWGRRGAKLFSPIITTLYLQNAEEVPILFATELIVITSSLLISLHKRLEIDVFQ
jgi:hypothetical protein